MVKIKKLIISFSVIYIFLLLEGCKETEHVFLENNTNEMIGVQVYLLTKNGEQILETNINPNQNDGWSYEVETTENMVIDKKLIKLIITNSKGCNIEINRKEIKKYIIKSGVWRLNIDSRIMNCK